MEPTIKLSSLINGVYSQIDSQIATCDTAWDRREAARKRAQEAEIVYVAATEVLAELRKAADNLTEARNRRESDDRR